MTWIKTERPGPQNPELLAALEAQAAHYPQEYRAQRYTEPTESRVPEAVLNDSIVMSHSLLPEALRHAFGTFGALLDPALPLTRRQHEMIATTVSALNRCFF